MSVAIFIFPSSVVKYFEADYDTLQKAISLAVPATIIFDGQEIQTGKYVYQEWVNAAILAIPKAVKKLEKDNLYTKDILAKIE